MKRLFTLMMLTAAILFSASFAAEAAPAQPRITKVTTGESQVKLKWSKVSGATAYLVYMQQGTTLKKIATVKSSKRTYTVKNLRNSREYVFYVAARGKKGVSEKSAPVKAAPQVSSPGALVNPRVVGNSSRKVSLRWAEMKKASGYIVYQKMSDGTYKKLFTTKKYKVTITGLANGNIYYFAVRAYRTAGGATTYGPMSPDLKGMPSVASSTVKAIHAYYYKVKVKKTTTATKVGGGASLTLRKGTAITVTQKGSSRCVATIKGSSYRVPTSALNFDNYSFVTNYKKAYSRSQAEAYVNYKGYSSPSKWLIWVNTYSQTMYLFTGSQYGWTLYRSWLCATGMAGTYVDFKDNKTIRRSETPLGVSKIYRKETPWIFAADQYAYYANIIMGGAIHSWLYYPATMTKWAAGKLGTPSSHGCVRVDIQNAKFIYENLPIGTTVVVY